MTDHLPKVTIGMPVYNSERYVAQAIEAHLSQTFDDFELVISDNASTDGTEDIVRRYADSDSRIRYVRQSDNVGASDNFRIVFELRRAGYFRWAASDDLVGRDLLARTIEILDSRPEVVLAYPRTRFIGADGETLGDHADNLHIQNARPSDRFIEVEKRLGRCNAAYGLMRAHLLGKTALFGKYIASDLPFMAELSLYGAFWEIPEVLFFRRLHPDAYSQQPNANDRLSHFDPSARRVTHHWIMWRHLYEKMRAVGRSPLNWPEKTRLRYFLLRSAVSNRYAFAREIIDTFRRR